VIAASGPTALWYAARSTGYVSLLVLTVILVLGIVTAMRLGNREWPRFLTQALHRNLSLMVLVFLAIHIVTSVVDPFAGIAPLNAVAPFTGSYRPLWLGLGVVSVELLVALTITSLLRQRIGFRVWRATHWAAYLCWPLALLHTLGTGSDVRSPWALLLGLGCVVAVVGALVWRLSDAARRALPGMTRTGGLLVTAAATVAILGFAVAGPLQRGWAKAAGTPEGLLALASAGAAAAVVPSPTTAPALAPGLADQVTGTVAQSGGTVRAALVDSRDGNLRIVVTVAGNAATGQVTISENGTVVCRATASITPDVVATCGPTTVDVSLSQQADGSLAGQLTTRAAGR